MTRSARAFTLAAATGSLMLATAAPAAAASPSYTYTQVDATTPLGSCTNVVMNSITNTGVMLGTEYCTSNRASRGFVDRHGKDQVFRAPGNSSVDTEPAGISNNAKYIVLETQQNFVGRNTSYLRTNGKLHKLSDPKAGNQGTVVEAVNNHKEIVGYYYTGRGTKHYQSFIDKRGKFRTFHLKVKSAVDVAVIDVNDHGGLAGYFQDRHYRYHGFLVQGHTTRVINAPGAGHGKNLGTTVLSMSNNGTYCGNIQQRHGAITANTFHGFIHRNGKYQSIKLPNSFSGHDTNAGSCNDSGQIAGSYVVNLGGSGAWQRDGFSATPSA